MSARGCLIIVAQWLILVGSCYSEDRQTNEKKDLERIGQDRDAAMLQAVTKGDLAEVKRLEREMIQPGPNLALTAWGSPNAEVVAYLRERGRIAASDLQITTIRGDATEVSRLLRDYNAQKYPRNSEDAYKFGPNFGYLASTSHTPLRLAIRSGRSDIVRVLIEGGANVNEQIVHVRPHSFWDEFPISEAIYFGHTEIIQLLLAGGATLEESPVRYQAKDDKVDLDAFFKRHADLPKSMVDRKLHEMVSAGLVTQEPQPFANETCPLSLAISSGRAKIVKLLLNGGANPNVRIMGNPFRDREDRGRLAEIRPLHIAAIKGNPETVSVLIKSGADVNATTSDGRTPLSYGIGFQHGDVADLLRAAGAK